MHSVQADDKYDELVISPSAAASIDADSPPDAQAAWPWAAWLAPSPLVGGIPAETWGQLFWEHPALLQPLLSWVHQELGQIFQTRRSQALILENAIRETLRLFGLGEELLVQLLEQDLGENTATFVRHLLDVAVQQCGREAHRLLGLNVPPVDDHREASPVPEPGPSSPEGMAPTPGPVPSSQPAGSSGVEVPSTSRDALQGSPSHHSTTAAVPMEQAAPQEEPQEAEAGPSMARQGRGCPPGGPRRAPKRKKHSSQASSAPPKKRPPHRRQ